VRHGYTRIPVWSERLAAQGFAIEAQARFSRTLRALAVLGLPAPVREPARAGLAIEDRAGALLFSARPAPGYADFESVPPPAGARSPRRSRSSGTRRAA